MRHCCEVGSRSVGTPESTWTDKPGSHSRCDSFCHRAVCALSLSDFVLWSPGRDRRLDFSLESSWQAVVTPHACWIRRPMPDPLFLPLLRYRVVYRTHVCRDCGRPCCAGSL